MFLPTPTVRAGETVADPYFGGRGPARTACDGCGNCMVGCRRGAKNTLVKNYLHLAEAAGARVEPLRTVTRVEPLDPGPPGRGLAGDDAAHRQPRRARPAPGGAHR